MAEIQPGSVFTHRTAVVSADGTTPPAANDSKWIPNPGFSKARVYAYVTFTGGSSPYLVLRAWVRSHKEGASGKVGKGESLTVTGTDQVAFDVGADGDDLLVYIESIGGG